MLLLGKHLPEGCDLHLKSGGAHRQPRAGSPHHARHARVAGLLPRRCYVDDPLTAWRAQTDLAMGAVHGALPRVLVAGLIDAAEDRLALVVTAPTLQEDLHEFGFKAAILPELDIYDDTMI